MLIESRHPFMLATLATLAGVVLVLGVWGCGKPSPEAPIASIPVQPTPPASSASPAASVDPSLPPLPPPAEAYEILVDDDVPPPPSGDLVDPFNPRPRPPRPPTGAGAAGCAPFDRGAAASAVRAVSLRSCMQAGGPNGAGHVTIIFATTGAVSAVTVNGPPYAGTPSAACVAQKLRGIRIPAFCGSPVRIGKSFMLN